MNIFKTLSVLYYIAMAMVFLGIIMVLSDVSNSIYVYGGGAIFMFLIRLYNQAVAKPENKRINTILLISTVFLLIAGWLMYTNRHYWIIFIFITATLDTYASFRRFKK